MGWLQWVTLHFLPSGGGLSPITHAITYAGEGLFLLLLCHEFEHVAFSLFVVHSIDYRTCKLYFKKWWMSGQKHLIDTTALRNGLFIFILESPPGCSECWGKSPPPNTWAYSQACLEAMQPKLNCFPLQSKYGCSVPSIRPAFDR